MTSNNQLSLSFSNGFLVGVGLGFTVIGLSATLFAFKSSSLTKLCKDYLSEKTHSLIANQRNRPSTAVTTTTKNVNHLSHEAQEERAAERDAFWFTENLTPDFGVRMTLKKILFEGRSTFQLVQVIETVQFGKTLVMDGQSQSAEADEYIYHEALVHPSLLLHPNPKSVYIGGGGEFATAREVLRHKSVEKCIMVDIDKVACDVCREHLPEWNNGSYEDSRFQVYYTDAKAWLEDHPEEKFDVIILDIVDPIEAGPGYKLYTQEFYNFLKSRLNNNGIVVTQSGPAAVFNAKNECFTVINNTLNSSFDCVIPYIVDVPSFGSNWGFNMTDPVNGTTAIIDKSVAEIDQLISTKIKGKLKFLDGISFKGIFGVPKSIREECELEDRVMTVDNPVFMYSS